MPRPRNTREQGEMKLKEKEIRELLDKAQKPDRKRR